MVSGPSSYATCKARSVNCLTTIDVGLTGKLARVYDTDFVEVQPLDKEHSVEDPKAVAVVESGSQVLGSHSVVPLPRNSGAKTELDNYALRKNAQSFGSAIFRQ